MHFFQFWEHSPSSRSSMCSAKYIYSMSSQCADKQWPYGTLSTRTPSPSSVPCQTPFSTTGPQTSGSLPLAAEDAECNLTSPPLNPAVLNFVLVPPNQVIYEPGGTPVQAFVQDLIPVDILLSYRPHYPPVAVEASTPTQSPTNSGQRQRSGLLVRSCCPDTAMARRNPAASAANRWRSAS